MPDATAAKADTASSPDAHNPVSAWFKTPAGRIVSRLGGLVFVIGAGALAITLFVGVVSPAVGDVRSAGDLWLDKDGDPQVLPALSEPSQVFAADGTFLTKFKADVDRQPVPLSQVPDHVRKAIVAAEDERFYAHDGIDLHSMGRAFASNLSSGGVSQGGSTITQQVIKNTYFIDEKTGVAKQTMERKFKELFMARRLEKKMNKDQILERYLNTVYFGQGAYGIQAASRAFFNKDVQNINVGDAVLLAGLIASPTKFDPYSHPQAAAERRDRVAATMRKLTWIGDEDVANIHAYPLPTVRFATDQRTRTNSYFVEAVKQELLDPKLNLLKVPGQDLKTIKANLTDRVFRGGLQIVTTLDPRLQNIAEGAVEAHVPDDGDPYTGALASVDVDSGAVRAIYGGRDFAKEQFNFAVQGRRNGGSTMKVFATVAALQQGYSPQDMYDGTSGCRYKDPRTGKYMDQPRGGVSSDRAGMMTLWEGLYYSVNCVFVNLVNTIGPDAVADTAAKLGVDHDHLLDASGKYVPPSVVLGGTSVTPLEMAAGYASIASGGVRRPAHIIAQITDPGGNVVHKPNPASAEQVVDPNVAYSTIRMMKDVLTKGTAAGQGIGRPSAGKTGTTNGKTDAWFVGFTPHLATAVWTGNPEGEVRGAVGFGAQSAAPIWHDFMKEATDPQPEDDWPDPDMGAFRSSRKVGKQISTTTSPDGGDGTGNGGDTSTTKKKR